MYNTKVERKCEGQRHSQNATKEKMEQSDTTQLLILMKKAN
jgi:hypothetical protein